MLTRRSLISSLAGLPLLGKMLPRLDDRKGEDAGRQLKALRGVAFGPSYTPPPADLAASVDRLCLALPGFRVAWISAAGFCSSVAHHMNGSEVDYVAERSGLYGVDRMMSREYDLVVVPALSTVAFRERAATRLRGKWVRAKSSGRPWLPPLAYTLTSADVAMVGRITFG